MGSAFSVVLREGPTLTIDGSAGEGGGQILRSSLALSMITGRPFVLEHIRARRKKPGLMRQHLTCVRVAAEICGAQVEGAELGSARLLFSPGRVRSGSFAFDVGSAGSTSLVLQTVALPLALAREPCELIVRGGTHARWAPIYHFLENAWLPPVRAAGASLTLQLLRTGFYPAGDGRVRMCSEPFTLGPLHLPASSGRHDLRLTANYASLPETVASRELSAAAALLEDSPALRRLAVNSAGPGNAIWLEARDRNSGVCNVFSAIGERGVRAEDVGAACARAYLEWQPFGASVEAHLADQLMLPIAAAGEGSYTCDELTLHSRTNLEVIHAFTGERFRVTQLARGYRIELAR